MARRYRDVRQFFLAGVVSPEHVRNPNVARTALIEGRNCFITDASTLIRRPGSVLIATLGTANVSREASGRLQMRHLVFDAGDGGLRHMFLTAGEARIYTETGALEATLTGPWVADDIYRMSVQRDYDQIFIASQSFFPHVLRRDFDTNTWTSEPFAFSEDPSGRRSSPFERFQARGVTINTSAYSGTVTVDFSADVLTPDHVGVHFLIGFGVQVEITAVTDAQTGTGEVKGILFPTQSVTVAQGSAFTVGDIIEGDTSNVRGLVVAKVGNDLTVVNISEYSLFQGPTTVDGATVDGEILAGPNGSSAVTATSQNATPSATNIWFEEIISSARGFPSTVCLHRSRLCFAGFPQLPSHLVASSVNAFTDFDIGEGQDSDAIITRLGNNSNERIRHLVSREMLIVLTDKGAYYVPEGRQQQFTQTGVSFDSIGPEIADFQQPTVSSEGVIFIDIRGRVILLSLTGTQSGAWSPLDLSRLGHHLIKSPVQIEFGAGLSSLTERVLTVLNDDGSMAVMSYTRGAEQAGWTLWDRPGQFHTVAPWEGQVYCVGGAEGDTTLERFDAASVVDAERPQNSSIQPDMPYAVVQGRHVTQTAVADGSGQISGGLEGVAATYGQDFDVVITPCPYSNENVGRLRRRIYEVWVDVYETGTFHLAGELKQGYDYLSSVDTVPEVNTRTESAHTLGSSHSATISIEQKAGEGAPFHLREMTLKVKG